MSEHEGGAEWERQRALRGLRDWTEINRAQNEQLPHVVSDLLTAAFSGASAQASQSTLFLVEKIEKLIEDVADLKTLVRDNYEQIAALNKEISDLRAERREAGQYLQDQITELQRGR